MATEIKAIETVYKGYRFRSRIEARWAVFFDTLGIKYEYEKEGYDLDGLWYLPDFWLPELKCWIEIKGEEPTIEECMKCKKLMLHANPWDKHNDPHMYNMYKNLKNVFCFAGDIPFPDSDNSTYCYSAYCFSKSWPELEYRGTKTRYNTKLFGWSECPFCHAVSVSLLCSMQYFPCKCEKMYIRSDSIGEIIEDRYHSEAHTELQRQYMQLMSDKIGKFLSWHDTPRLIEAYTAARQARFDGR